VGAFASRGAPFIHAENSAPHKSVDYKQVRTVGSTYRRYGFLPEDPAVGRIVSDDQFAGQHYDDIVNSDEGSGGGQFRPGRPELPAVGQAPCDKLFSGHCQGQRLNLPGLPGPDHLAGLAVEGNQSRLVRILFVGALRPLADVHDHGAAACQYLASGVRLLDRRDDIAGGRVENGNGGVIGKGRVEAVAGGDYSALILGRDVDSCGAKLCPVFSLPLLEAPLSPAPGLQGPFPEEFAVEGIPTDQ